MDWTVPLQTTLWNHHVTLLGDSYFKEYNKIIGGILIQWPFLLQGGREQRGAPGTGEYQGI